MLGYAGCVTYELTSKAKTQSIPVAIDVPNISKKKATKIYRYGSYTYTNFSPRPQDITGLSFSLTPPTSGSYSVTTIDAVYKTGVLVDIIDGPNHVSVRPKKMSTMSSWISSRTNANTSPHPYSIILRSISIRIK